MKNYVLLLFSLIIVLPLYQCHSQTTKTSEIYAFKDGDYNGTGKWYMGREIAYVMGFQGISWLERPEREEEEKASKLISNMAIKPTDNIADIGAGSGYHVFKIAPKAEKGTVYAVDIQQEMLNALQTRPDFKKFKNIKTVLSGEQTVNLPENSIDKVLMVDVYHEFSFPYEMVLSIKKALRKEGKIYLIEYRGEDATVPIKSVHKMTESQAVKELKAAGFKLEKNIINLPWQHCMVFVKN